MKNNPLKEKIREKCGDISKFCRIMGCSRSCLYKITSGQRNGTAEFWRKAQQVLGISDKDMWRYINFGREGREND